DARDQLRAAIGRDAVVVSESFALRFRTQPGDVIELPTPTGDLPFYVAAVFFDYSNSRGLVVMDRRTYARHFPAIRPSRLSIYVRPGSDAEMVNERLAQVVGTQYQLVFSTNAAVRNEVMHIFDSTFTITYALELIAIVVAVLGVIATLMTLILERR